MIRLTPLILVLATCGYVYSQDLKVEYDKKADLSQYKSYRFGEGEIITPKDQRQVEDATTHSWVKKAISEELESKGLVRRDSADLVVSYIVGTQARSDAGNVGPLGLTPGANPSQTYIRDYSQGSLVIDLNDPKNAKLVWRIIGIADMASTGGQRAVDKIVVQGFKKFSIQPKKKKKAK